jgi:hypothetical protein
LLARFLNLIGYELFIGQDRAVFSRENFVRQSIKRVTRDRFIFLAAKNETNRRIFAFVRPMFARVVEIHVHLASIGMSEPAALEIDDDEAPQLAMKEQQIDAILFIADAEAALASDKSEIASEF